MEAPLHPSSLLCLSLLLLPVLLLLLLLLVWCGCSSFVAECIGGGPSRGTRGRSPSQLAMPMLGCVAGLSSCACCAVLVEMGQVGRHIASASTTHVLLVLVMTWHVAATRLIVCNVAQLAHILLCICIWSNMNRLSSVAFAIGSNTMNSHIHTRPTSSQSTCTCPWHCQPHDVVHMEPQSQAHNPVVLVRVERGGALWIRMRTTRTSMHACI